MKFEKHLNLTDKLKRKYFLKFYFINKINKILLKNLNLKLIYKYYISLKKSKVNSFSFLTKISKRCIISGRKYGYLNFFKFSRFFTRTSVHKEYFLGVSRYKR